MSSPEMPSLILSQSGPLRTTCSLTEKSRLRSSSRTADASLWPAIHPRCRISEEWLQLRCWQSVSPTTCPWTTMSVASLAGACRQLLDALKVLRSHGMNDDSLRDIHKVVALAKLFYVWWGFTTASDWQRIDAFVRRCVRLGLYSAGDPAPTQLNDSADGALFERILHNPNHMLHGISTATWPQHNSISPETTTSRQNLTIRDRQPAEQ